MEQTGVSWCVVPSFCVVKTSIHVFGEILFCALFCYVGSFCGTKVNHLNLKWFNLIVNCFSEDMIFVCQLYGIVQILDIKALK